MIAGSMMDGNEWCMGKNGDCGLYDGWERMVHGEEW